MNNLPKKIFIASSIVEFENERDVIENYLWKQNGNGKLTVIPLRCENADPAMNAKRKEDDFCSDIAQSDVCLFILGKKVGVYTQEEYYYAQNLIKNGKNLRILAFCKGDKDDPFYKVIADDKVETYDYRDADSLISLLEQNLTFNAQPTAYAAEENAVYIFLASSVKEDKQQELRIENFIWRMNYEFSDKYNLSILPLSSSNPGEQKLDEIISKSAMCFFIVFGKVACDVMDELKIAKYNLDNAGNPRIYVYFKTVKGDEEQSVTQFKKYLDSELQHFYGSFDDLDTVKLRILLNLAILKTGSQEVSFKDGKCYLGSGFSLNVKNVSEFANNKKLAELKTALENARGMFDELKIEYNKHPSDSKICEAYITAASNYETLKKEVEEMENSIFSVSLSMCKDETGGTVTERQKRAYKLFTDGEVEKAVELLDIDESVKSYERLANYAKHGALNVISEGRQKIFFLKTMRRYAKRDEIICETYEKLLPIAAAQQTELGVFNEYALFLKNCNRHKDALNCALKLQSIYEIFPPNDKLEYAENLTLLAMIYSEMSDKQTETVNCSLQAIELRKAAAENGYDEKNYIGLARAYNALGDIYRRANAKADADGYFELSKQAFDELEKHTDKYVTEHAETLIAHGIYYSEQYQSALSFAEFDKAIKILDTYPSDDPHALYVKSSAYQNQASLTKKENQLQKANGLFKKALKIRKELSDENPARYLPALAHTYQAIGNVYRAMDGKFETACKYFLLAYDIRTKLCLVNKSAREVELSDSCVKLAGTLLDLKRPDEALPYLRQGYEIRRPLYEKHSKTYEKWYAQTLFEFGRYYQQKGDMTLAEDYYNKAFEIRVKISEENLRPNVEGLHDSFTKMKQLYGDGYADRLSKRERALRDKLYSFAPQNTQTGKTQQFRTSFTD